MARNLIAVLSVALVAACDSGSSGDSDASSSTGSSGGDTSADSDGSGTTGTPSTSATAGTNPGTTDDGTTSDDASGGESSSTGAEPEGVPVVVSLAHGGQTARSCDGGQTWSDFHDFGIQDDHSDYAAFAGLTYGNGVFVGATGWGAPAHVLRSTDGITWEDAGDDAFVTDKGSARPQNGSSGVEFVGDGFVLFAGPEMWRSDDGLVWTASTPPSLAFSGHFREVEYLAGPDLLLIATEDYETPQSWLVQVSADGGESWQTGTGATAACVGYVQHNGGFATYDGRLLLAGGDGPTCVSDDGGLTWSEAGNVGAPIADVEATDDGFVVLTAAGEVLTSADAVTWTPLGSAGVQEGRIGWSDGFFGESGGVYVHSADGATWADAAGTPPKGFGGVREFAVGHIPSCP